MMDKQLATYLGIDVLGIVMLYFRGDITPGPLQLIVALAGGICCLAGVYLSIRRSTELSNENKKEK
ncbi:MAG: hypothetical protein ACRDDX_01925 [Cellulosilyticaceae bacterium]